MIKYSANVLSSFSPAHNAFVDGHLKNVPSKPSNVVKFWTRRDNTKSKLSHYVVGLFVCFFVSVPKLISFEASKTVVRWVVRNLFVICHSTYLSITTKEMEKNIIRKHHGLIWHPEWAWNQAKSSTKTSMTNYICFVNRNTVLAGVCMYFFALYFSLRWEIYTARKKKNQRNTPFHSVIIPA